MLSLTLVFFHTYLLILCSGVVCPTDHPGDHCLHSNDADLDSVTTAVKNADQVVVFLGLDQYDEREGTDRQSLTLSPLQTQILSAAAEAAGPAVPVVVVLNNGGAVAMDYSIPDAVVEAFAPGIEGSPAIACALFGDTGCNRWGRLPVTVMPETFRKNDMANMYDVRR